MEWEQAETTLEKQALKQRWRAEQIDGGTITRWKEILGKNATSPKVVRAAQHEYRLRGAGRTPDLSEEMETQIDEWVMDRRRRLLQVRVCDIQAYAKHNFRWCQDGRDFTGGDKWVAGFMQRQCLSLRLATTNKNVTSPAMRITQFHFRNKLAATCHTFDTMLMYNMDETSVTLDQPGTRTVDRIGTKCVPIGTTGHQCDRVAVVICVSRGGTMVTPLVIRVGGKTSHYYGVFIRETHGGTDMFVTESKKAWLNSDGMVKWLQLIYMPSISETRMKLAETLLFMDNCSVHDSEQSTATLNEQRIPHHFFPPHCTPILQPCDQNVNHMFKMEYERQWAEWMAETGSRDDNVTRYGNPAAAGKATYMAWIGRALACIDKKVIDDSWRMSCAGYKFSMFHLPSRPWLHLLSFLPRSTTVGDTAFTKEEAAWEDVIGMLQHHRKLHTAWRDYVFPVKNKRKKAAVGIVTTSAPSKRRRTTTHVSDAETESDTEAEAELEQDKENQPMDVEARDALRTVRYKQLQNELEAGGSTRVINKRVTSELWAAREPLQLLDSNVVVT